MPRPIVHWTKGAPDWKSGCGADGVPMTMNAAHVTCKECREKIPKFQDAADMPEDKRITLIGKKAMKGEKVAFITDVDPGKADRYVRKLLERFPDLEVYARGPGPVPDTVTVCVKRKDVPLPS